MKDIKFRAWDKVKKRMFYFNSGFGWNDEYDFWYLQGANANVPCENNIELMQYTGLKDKYGKKIYEGDILLNPYGDRNYYVEYQPPEFIMRWLTNSGKPSKQWTQFIVVYKEPQLYEVIGNIYQKPELLTPKITVNTK